MPLNGDGWEPTEFRRFIESLGSSTRTALVDTNAGTGYLKGLGNPEGPQALAAEYIGSELASWLGLPTLDYAVMNVRETDEIPLRGGGRISAGPAFVSRNVLKGEQWDGSPALLNRLSNPDAISGLVAVDTWIRNCDRSSPDRQRRHVENVFLVWQPKPIRKFKMIAMDFTHSFNCGHEITHRISNIEFVKDNRLYGMFAEFEAFMNPREISQLAAKLGSIRNDEIQNIINSVPLEWGLSHQVRASLGRFILERAQFLSDYLGQIVQTSLNPIAGGA